MPNHRSTNGSAGWRGLGTTGEHPDVDFLEMMRLDPEDDDVFRATGPRYPWGGLYGGQIVAQSLRAGAATVDERFAVHSLHAYFVRRGSDQEPIRFEVTRSREGRSFVTRSVVARQEVGVILTMSMSFQVDEEGHDVQTASLPDIPAPAALVDTSWSPMFDRRFAAGRGADEGKGVAWLRLRDDVGDDRVLQACALAYLSDDVPTDAVVALHPDRPEPDAADPFEEGWMSASLDHAIWFHRPSPPDQWHLHDLTAHAYLSSRGVAVGHILRDDGTHVATVAQEVLLRSSR